MNTKKSKKNNAKSPSAANKKEVTSKPREPVEPSSENEEGHSSSGSEWEPMNSDSDDEYTEEDMESYLRAFYRNMWVRDDDPGPSRPDLFYQYFCKDHFKETRQHLIKKKASKGKKKTTKQLTVKGKKKKISKNEEKVQAALLKLMPTLYKTQLKVMSRRILKAKPINQKLLQALRDIMKNKHLEHKVTGKTKYGMDLDPEQLQIADLLHKSAKGYTRTHVVNDVASQYLIKLSYQRDKQKRLERLALAAAGGSKKVKGSGTKKGKSKGL